MGHKTYTLQENLKLHFLSQYLNDILIFLLKIYALNLIIIASQIGINQWNI